MSNEESVEQAEPAPKKSKRGLIIGLAVGVVVLIGGAVAGLLLGPKLLGNQAHASAPEAAEAEPPPKAEEEHIVAVELPPIVIDIRSQDGKIHHLKVGLSAELAKEVVEEEFTVVIPRGREAAVDYLRTLTFEEIGNPKRYAAIKEELSKRVLEAVGHQRAHRILLVEFVAQ